MSAIYQEIAKADLSAKELAATIADIMIEHYGQHNYKEFKNVINTKLS